VLTDVTEGQKTESKMLGRTAGSAGDLPGDTGNLIRRVSACLPPWRASTVSAPLQRCAPGPPRSSSASWSSRPRLFAASHVPKVRVEQEFQVAHFGWAMRRRRVGLVLIPVCRFSLGAKALAGVGL
jgi:hypothetical protein